MRTIVKKKKRVNIFKQFLLHFAFFLLNENVENLILLFVFMQKIIRENFFLKFNLNESMSFMHFVGFCFQNEREKKLIYFKTVTKN